jgi:hypothetical protein
MADAARDRQLGPDLIGGAFEVDFARPLPGLGGGLAAFAAIDRKGAHDQLMALRVERHAPPRPQALAVLSVATVPGVATPLGHGTASVPDGEVYVVICRAPSGKPVGTATTIGRRWGEGELLSCVLRPVTLALAQLQTLRVTHRAIRPNNLFQVAERQPVTLGAAWAAPPASLQPAVFESPYSGWCLPAGRGEGSIADDIYALGVVLLALAAGAIPLADVDEAEMLRRKETKGSYAALAAGLSIPSSIAELASGMLADDPHHRPSAKQLTEPELVRNRRVSTAPARRAPRPLDVAGHTVWDARSLASALFAAPDHAARLMQAGVVDRWLVRVLADGALSARLDETLRVPWAEGGISESASEAVLLARVIGALDPLAPLCWRGLAIWPDGLGPALAAASPDQEAKLQELVESEGAIAWASAGPERVDPLLLRTEARFQRTVVQKRSWFGGMAVLRYALNPLLACRSPVLGNRLVIRIDDLLPVLEVVAGSLDRRPALPVDAEIAAFIAARDTLRLGRELAGAAAPQPGAAGLAGPAASGRAAGSGSLAGGSGAAGPEQLAQPQPARPRRGRAARVRGAGPPVADGRGAGRCRRAGRGRAGSGCRAASAGADQRCLDATRRAADRPCRGGQARRPRSCRRVRPDRAVGGGAGGRAGIMAGRGSASEQAARPVPGSSPVPASGPAPGGGPASGGRARFYLEGLVCGVGVTLVPGSAVLAAALLLPALLARFGERGRGRPVARCMLLFGAAGSLQTMMLLWHSGGGLQAGLALALDVPRLARAWAAQALGWLLAESLPLLFRLLSDAQTAVRVRNLQAQRRKLLEEWPQDRAE